MKRIVVMLILCILAAGMIFSCCCFHEAATVDAADEKASYMLDYVRDVYILREVK